MKTFSSFSRSGVPSSPASDDVGAVTFLLEHPQDARELTLGTLEAVDNRADGLDVQLHGDSNFENEGVAGTLPG